MHTLLGSFGAALDQAQRDVRHAWRTIVRMPILALVVIASVGVGIGVNTAVFSWIQMMVLRPLPGVTRADGFRLVEPRTDVGSYPGTSWLEYQDVRREVPALPDLIAFRMAPLAVGEASRKERTYGLMVSGNYFSALGLRPSLGRFIGPNDANRPGAEPVVVISHEFWQNRLGGRPGIVGETVTVNDQSLTIVGIAPPAFQGTVLGLHFDLWVPATLAPVLLNGSRELEDRTVRGYSVMGSLGPSATDAQAQREIDSTMRRLAAAYPATNATMTAEVLPFWWSPRGPQRLFVRSLWILQTIMVLLLLVVCANTVNLLLARASTRHREVGVRAALGASRWQIVTFVLSESLLLAFLGAALGVVVAIWVSGLLRAVPITMALPIRFQTGVDGVALTFAASLGLACGLLFGTAPALQLARVAPLGALRATTYTPARSRLRHVLMSLEVALAVVVLIAAGLFLRSFQQAKDTDPGFQREGVLLAAYDLSSRSADDSSDRTFASRLLDRLRESPAVQSAAIAQSVPLDIHGLPLRTFTLEGRVRSEAAQDRALSNVVTPGYFATMGIPLLRGTDFVDLRDVAAPAQVIVNDAFVRRYLTGAEPLGRTLTSRDISYVIGGVVRNSVNDAFGEAPTPVVYFSYRDRPQSAGEIHVRTRGGSEASLAGDVRRAVQSLDPQVPVYNFRTLSDHIDTNLFLRRVPARMFLVLGPLLLALAAIGIYAVVSYTVARRTSEIGIRLALGGTSRRVIAQLMGESLRPVATGMTLGWLAAFIVAIHLVRGSTDLLVFAGIPAILLLVAGFASWMPARRALRLDPVAALRQE